MEIHVRQSQDHAKRDYRTPGSRMSTKSRCWRIYGLLGRTGSTKQQGRRDAREYLDVRSYHAIYILHLQTDQDTSSQLASAFLDAGSETTSAYLRTLVLILIEFPEYQAKAQKEMDWIIGTDRMPALEDAAQLPFVEALIKEASVIRGFLVYVFTATSYRL